MKMIRTVLFLLPLFALAGLLFAHDPAEYGNLSGNAYESGYASGYQHGSADVQARLNFDFRHENQYSNSGIQNLTCDTSGSCEARIGYLEGYADGYFRHQARFGGNYNSGYGNNREYDNNSGYGTPTRTYSDSNISVVVFTNSGYSGESQQVRIGQYPRLDSPMNDSIDSIAVRGNVRVILFDKSNFGGQRIVLDHDAPDLGDFKNKAASMIVEYTNR